VQGNGAQTVFNYGFLIPTADAADLYFTDVISGATYPLPASAWSLSGVNNSLGGTFTYPVSGGSVLQSTQRLTLVRRVPNTQNTSLQNQSGFQPRALERALDWIVMQVQQVANRTQQTIRVPSAEQVLPDLPSANLRKNTMLSFDANGSPLLLPLQPANNTTIIAQGGTTPRALAVRFSDTKNVADYGVVGDGVADDTAAINALIALVAPNTKLVFAPGATYRVTGTININRTNIHLEGYGAEIRQDTPGIDIIRAGLVGPSGQYDYLFGVSIYGLTCRYSTRSIAAGAAIRMNRCTNYKLIDVFTYDGFNGIVIEGGSYGMLHTPRLTHNTYGVPRGAGSSLLNLKSFDTGSGIQPCYTVNMTNFQLVAPDLSQCVLIQSADGLICSAGYMWGAKDRLVAYDTDNSAAYLAGVRWSNTYFDCGSPPIGTNGHEFANFTGTLGQIYDVVIDSTCLIGNGAGVGVLINRANLGKIRIDAEIINFNSWGVQLYAGSNVELDFGGRIFRSSLATPSGGLLAQGGKSLRVTGSFTLCGPVALETSGSWELGSIVGASAESTTRDWVDTATWARPVQLAGNTSDVTFGSPGSWVQSLPGDGKVSVEDFGAIGNGIADDTPAFLSALATGKPVYAPRNTYRITSSLPINTNGQRFFGDGENGTVIVPSGNFDVVTLGAGVDHCGVERMTFNAAGMTGGYVVNCNGADRVYLAHLRINSPYNVARVYSCNRYLAETVYVQGPRGPYAWRCEGAMPNRSDVIALVDVNIGGDNSCVWDGISVDGAVNTLHIDRVTMVNHNRGIHYTTNATDALFVMATDFEADYGKGEALRLEAGKDFFFINSYMQGSGSYGGAPKSLVFAGPNVSNLRINSSFLTTNFGADLLDLACEDINISSSELLLPNFADIGANDVVRLRGTVRRARLHNNQYGGREGVGTVARYGVSVESGARGVQVSGDFYGCRIAPILDNSGAGSGQGVQLIAPSDQGRNYETVVSGVAVGTQDGWGATANCTVSAGAITALTLTDGGRDYRAPPNVAFYDPLGTGSGASATATLNGAGEVTGFSSLVGGSGYSAGTRVALISTNSTPQIRPRIPSVTNTGMSLRASGSGAVDLGNAKGVGFTAQVVEASSVNYLQARGRGTGLTPDIIAVGSDTDIDIGFFPKGAGTLRLGGTISGSAGALSGYLEVKIGGVVRKIPYYLP
jgi:hypothetical protein